MLQAARRLENRAAYLQTVVVAEFARRRAAQFEDAKARKVPPAAARASSRPTSWRWSWCVPELRGPRIEHDLALTARLPMTLAGMAAG